MYVCVCVFKSGYKTCYWYWEGIVLVRKLSLAAMGVLLASSSAYLQGLVAIFILSTSLFLQLKCDPYQDKSLNALEAFGLTCGVLTLYVGLWTFEQESSFTKEIGLAASGVIFFTNGVWLMIALGAIFRKYLPKACVRLCVKKNNRVNVIEARGIDDAPSDVVEPVLVAREEVRAAAAITKDGEEEVMGGDGDIELKGR